MFILSVYREFEILVAPLCKKLAQNQNDFYLISGIKIEFLFIFFPRTVYNKGKASESAQKDSNFTFIDCNGQHNKQKINFYI